MSTVAEETPGGRGAPKSGGGYERPSAYARPGATGEKKSRFELYSWVFMRISGLLLIFMALYHLVWWNLLVGVEHLSAELVLERWSNPLWRLFNVALAAFAMLHGLNGARYSIEDYTRKPGTRKAVKAIVYGIVLLALAWGIFALLTYDFSDAAARAR
jgi:succinate dehydrogenase / fumarate reductase membrane anchor subunit